MIRFYTPAEDAAIIAQQLPDSLLAMAFGRTRYGIHARRARIRAKVQREGYIAPPEPTPAEIRAREAAEEAERVALLHEEIEALTARIEDTETLLQELHEMLRRRRSRLYMIERRQVAA